MLLLILFPYLETAGLPTALFRLLGVSAFLSCVYAVSEERAQWITALAIALSAGILNTIYVLKPSARAPVPTLTQRTEHRLEIRDEQVYGRAAEADD